MSNAIQWENQWADYILQPVQRKYLLGEWKVEGADWNEPVAGLVDTRPFPAMRAFLREVVIATPTPAEEEKYGTSAQRPPPPLVTIYDEATPVPGGEWVKIDIAPMYRTPPSPYRLDDFQVDHYLHTDGRFKGDGRSRFIPEQTVKRTFKWTPDNGVLETVP